MTNGGETIAPSTTRPSDGGEFIRSLLSRLDSEALEEAAADARRAAERRAAELERVGHAAAIALRALEVARERADEANAHVRLVDDETLRRGGAHAGSSGQVDGKPEVGIEVAQLRAPGPRLGGPLHRRANFGRVLLALAAGVRTQSEIGSALGLKPTAVGESLKRLRNEGLARKAGKGARHYLLDDGWDAVRALLAETNGGGPMPS
jgi:biotin operon repressor